GPGIGGARLRLVSSDGVAALVSDVRAEELRFGRAEMLAHSEVLGQALANGTVLPTRFGGVLGGDAAVRESVLDPNGHVLRAQLSKFDGRVELKLRGTYVEGRVMQEIVTENQDVASLRDSVRGVPDAASYYGRIRLGELVADAIERKRLVDSDQIITALA